MFEIFSNNLTYFWQKLTLALHFLWRIPYEFCKKHFNDTTRQTRNVHDETKITTICFFELSVKKSYE